MQKLPQSSKIFFVTEDGRNQLTTDRGAEYLNRAYEYYEELIQRHDSGEPLSQSDIDRVLQCPITSSFFENPVITPSGHTYEFAAINEWIRTRNTDPLSAATLEAHQLRPNTEIKRLTDDLIRLDTRPPAELERGMANRNFDQVLEDFSRRLDETIYLAVGVAAAPALMGSHSMLQASEAHGNGRHVQGSLLSTVGVGSSAACLSTPVATSIAAASSATLIGGSIANSAITSADAANVSSAAVENSGEEQDYSKGTSCTS